MKELSPKLINEIKRFYELKETPQEVHQKISQLSDEEVSAIIDDVRTTAFPGATPEQFEQAFSPQTQGGVEEGEGGFFNYFAQIGWGIGYNAVDIVGNAFRLPTTIQKQEQHRRDIVSEIGEDEYVRLRNGVLTGRLSDEDKEKINDLYAKHEPEREEFWNYRAGRALSDFAEEHLKPEKVYDWEDVKDNWFNAVPWAFQEGLSSLPYMAAGTWFGFPVIASAIANQIKERRGENPTMGDMSIAMAAGIGSAALGAFGANVALIMPLKNLFRKGGAQAKEAAEGGAVAIKLPPSITKRITKGGIIGATGEGSTEVGQQFVENAASIMSTPEWDQMTDEQKFDAITEGGLQSAVAGAIFGGGLRAGLDAIPPRQPSQDDQALAAQQAAAAAAEQQPQPDPGTIPGETPTETPTTQQDNSQRAEAVRQAKSGNEEAQAAADEALDQGAPAEPETPATETSPDETEADLVSQAAYTLHEEAKKGTRSLITDPGQLSEGMGVIVDFDPNPPVAGTIVKDQGTGALTAKLDDGRTIRPEAGYRIYTQSEEERTGGIDPEYSEELQRVEQTVRNSNAESDLRNLRSLRAKPEFLKLPVERRAEIDDLIAKTEARLKEAQQTGSQETPAPSPAPEPTSEEDGAPKGDYEKYIDELMGRAHKSERMTEASELLEQMKTTDFHRLRMKTQMEAVSLVMAKFETEDMAQLIPDDAERPPAYRSDEYAAEFRARIKDLEVKVHRELIENGIYNPDSLSQMSELMDDPMFPYIDQRLTNKFVELHQRLKKELEQDKESEPEEEAKPEPAPQEPEPKPEPEPEPEPEPQEPKPEPEQPQEPKPEPEPQEGKKPETKKPDPKPEETAPQVDAEYKARVDAALEAVALLIKEKRENPKASMDVKVISELIEVSKDERFDTLPVQTQDNIESLVNFLTPILNKARVDEENKEREETPADARVSPTYPNDKVKLLALQYVAQVGKVGDIKTSMGERPTLSINQVNHAIDTLNNMHRRYVEAGGDPEQLFLEVNYTKKEAERSLKSINRRHKFLSEKEETAILKFLNDLKNGRAPKFFPKKDVEGAVAYFKPGDSGIRLRARRTRQPTFHVIVHEMLHWAFYSGMTHEDRIAFMESIKRNYFDKDGNLIENKFPFSGKIDVNEHTHIGEQMHTIDELFVVLGSHWVAGKYTPETAYEESFWRRVTDFIEQFYRWFVGLEVPPDMQRIFENLLKKEAEYDAEQESPPMEPDSEPEPQPTTVEVSAQRKFAQTLQAELDKGRKFDNNSLFTLAREELGLRDPDPQMVYETVELAVNSIVREMENLDDIESSIKQLQALEKQLPVQSIRTKRKIEGQEYSTPPILSYMAFRAAGIESGHKVLEPSAGTGSLAAFAKAKGAEVSVNEIEPNRAALLRGQDFDSVTTHDAEHLSHILVVGDYDTSITNPPFSSRGHLGIRNNTSAVGANHLMQTLDLLAPGGRMVAIVGGNFYPENKRVRALFSKMSSLGTIRANVVVDGDIYRKYGTTYQTRMIVFDKVTGDPEAERSKQIDEKDSEPTFKSDSIISDFEQFMAKLPPRAKMDSYWQNRKHMMAEEETDWNLPSGILQDLENMAKGGKESLQKDPAQDPETEQRPRRRQRERKTVKASGKGRVLYEPAPWVSSFMPGATEHPEVLVESESLGSILAPFPEYLPTVLQKVVKEGRLSGPQVEMITVAYDAFMRGFNFVNGDATGVGKGREIVGTGMTMMDAGNGRFVWLSKNKDLLHSAKRDVKDMGMPDNTVQGITSTQLLDQMMNRGEKPKGVYFIPYTTLAGGQSRAEQVIIDEEGNPPSEFPNVDKLVQILGADYEGMIAADEAHLLASSLTLRNTETGRQAQQRSKRAAAFQYLEQSLPNARILYATATQASKPEHLAYLSLGLHGEGTPFSTVINFINEIAATGLVSMEMIPRILKERGLYMSRSISYEGVEYDTIVHEMTPHQIENYDTAADLWSLLHDNIEMAVEIIYPEGATQAHRNEAYDKAHYWGTVQRFFNMLLQSYQMVSVEEAIKGYLKEGYSVVIQTSSTGEAAVQAAESRLREEDGETYEDLELSPKEMLINMVETIFPIHQMEPVVDPETGEITTYRPVTTTQIDPNTGQEIEVPVVNAVAKKMQEDFLKRLEPFSFGENFLIRLFRKFGGEYGANIAEVTGRRHQFVLGPDKQLIKRERVPGQRIVETEEFQKGDRNMLVFSDAGGTGVSFHALPGQPRRMHIVFDPSWNIATTVQGYGRTHRTGQRFTPKFIVVSTDAPASKRKLSTVARNLAQLGAFTQGDRSLAGGGMLDPLRDSFENEYGEQAVRDWVTFVQGGGSELGLMRINDLFKMDITQRRKMDIKRFLNRLMTVRIAEQRIIFKEFESLYEARIQMAIQEDTLDMGLENIKTVSANINKENVIYKDPVNKTEARITVIDAKVPRKLFPFDHAEKQKNARFYQNKASSGKGRIYAVSDVGKTYDPAKGEYMRVRVTSPLRQEIKDEAEIGSNYEEVSLDEARQMWEEQSNQIPKEKDETIIMLTGDFLPIFDRIDKRNLRAKRVVLDDETSVLGFVLSGESLTNTIERLGIDENFEARERIPVEDAYNEVAESKKVELQISNGDRVKLKRVAKEDRIEVIPEVKSRDVFDSLEAIGFMTPVIYGTRRALLPYGDDGLRVFKRYMKNKDVIHVVGGRDRTRNRISEQTRRLREGDLSPQEVGHIFERVKTIASQIVPANVALSLSKAGKGKPPGWEGSFHFDQRLRKHLIQVATDAGNPILTLGHETIHALKELGLFTKAEWRKLRSVADKRGWLEKYKVKERYAEFYDINGKPMDSAYEEAIADAFGDRLVNGSDWRGGSAHPFVMRAFARIIQFFRDLVEVVQDLGGVVPRNIFKTDNEAETIFQRVMSGEIAKRQQKLTMIRRDARFRKAESPTQEPAPRFRGKVQERVDAADSKPENISDKIGKFIEHVLSTWHLMTRAFKHLPESGQDGSFFADMREKLVHLMVMLKEHNEVINLFNSLMKGLTQTERQVFRDLVILRDMRADVKRGIQLSFGMNPEEVESEIEKREEWIDRNSPELRERIGAYDIEKRELGEEAVKHGILTPQMLRDNPNHFRHEHAEWMRMGRGEGNTKIWIGKSHLAAKRRGSESDYSTDWLQVEVDYFMRLRHDIALAKFHKWFKGNRKYNVTKDFEAKAKAENNTRIQAIMKKDAHVHDKMRNLNQRIAAAFNTLGKSLSGRSLAELKAILPEHLHKELISFIQGEGRRKVMEDGANPFFSMVAHFAASDELPEVQRAALFLFNAINERKGFIRKTLGKNYINPLNKEQLLRRFDPEGKYAVYYFHSRNPNQKALTYFFANTISEAQMERLESFLDKMAEGMSEIDKQTYQTIRQLVEEQKTILAVGGPREPLIVRKEIADTLNHDVKEAAPEGWDRLFVKATGAWRLSVLFLPPKILKYLLNNLVGDIDAMLALGITRSSLREMKNGAAKEILDWQKHGIIGGDLKQALESGVLQNVVRTEYEDFLHQESQKELLQQAKRNIAVRGFRSYLHYVMQAAQFRENAFRYAVFKHYLRQIEAGKSLEEMGYGATPPHILRSLNKEDLAARMARDAMGDYAALSQGTRYLRKRYVPFVSWIYSNAVRYTNIYKNAIHMARHTGDTEGISRAALVGGTKLMRTVWLYTAFMAYNALVTPDEEDLLTPAERSRLHMNMPFRTADGSIVRVRFQGAFTDFASWFGVADEAQGRVIEVLQGREDISNALIEIGKAPVNKTINSINPFFKTLAEGLTGYAVWPDITRPRHIKNPAEHHAKTFALDAPTAQVMKIMGYPSPTRDLGTSILGVLFNINDPGEIAYQKFRTIGYERLEKETGQRGGVTSPKNKAMSKFFLALAREDERSASLAYKQIVDLSKGESESSKEHEARKSIKRSLKRRTPLGMLSKDQRSSVLGELTQLELSQLKEAEQWFRQKVALRIGSFK